MLQSASKNRANTHSKLFLHISAVLLVVSWLLETTRVVAQPPFFKLNEFKEVDSLENVQIVSESIHTSISLL